MISPHHPARGALDRIPALICGTLVAFLLVQILTFGPGRDQGIYAVVARSVVEGGMPYRDAWDFKPPGIFVLYAIARALFGANDWGIRLLECLFIIGMCVCIVRWARMNFAPKLSGYFAIALAVLIHAQLDFWHTAQPESFGGALTIFGLCTAPLFATDDRSPSRPLLRWFLSGALFGMAGLLKPQLAFGGGLLVMLPCAARLLRQVPFLQAFALPKDGPGEWKALFATGLGTVAPVALCILWFAAKGALKDAYEVLFVFTPHYTKISWEGQNPLQMAYHGVVTWFTGYSAFVPLGISLLLLFGHRLSPRERGAALALSVLIALHLAGVVAQAKFFAYHYGATWPLTALLVGVGFALLWDQMVKVSRWWIAAFAIGIPVLGFARSATPGGTPLSFFQRTAFRTEALLTGGMTPELRDQLATVDDVNASANRQIAQFFRETANTSTPGKPPRPVFIWGFEPVIYDWADRPASSRYIYNVPQRAAWLQQSMREGLMADLAAKPPEFIVVERRDVIPGVTGDTLDSAGSLKGFPELQTLIQRNYKVTFTHEDFMVLHEVTPPAQAPGS
jgi:hypothetical protein